MEKSVGVNQRAKEYIQVTGGMEHRVIWEKHHGKVPEGYCIHHKDGNKKNNRIENLECLSRKEHGKKHWKPNRIRIKYPSGIKVITKNDRN